LTIEPSQQLLIFFLLFINLHLVDPNMGEKNFVQIDESKFMHTGNITEDNIEKAIG